MAHCKWCRRNMLNPKTRTCSQTVEFPDGEVLPAVPYTHYPSYRDNKTGQVVLSEPIPPGSRCHDCGIEVGGVHHPGCDMECCPRCGFQLISCGCLDVGREE